MGGTPLLCRARCCHARAAPVPRCLACHDNIAACCCCTRPIRGAALACVAALREPPWQRSVLHGGMASSAARCSHAQVHGTAQASLAAVRTLHVRNPGLGTCLCCTRTLLPCVSWQRRSTLLLQHTGAMGTGTAGCSFTCSSAAACCCHTQVRGPATGRQLLLCLHKQVAKKNKNKSLAVIALGHSQPGSAQPL